MKRRKFNLKAKVESSFIICQFQAIRSRRFQRGVDRVDLHRPHQENMWQSLHSSSDSNCFLPGAYTRSLLSST